MIFSVSFNLTDTKLAEFAKNLHKSNSTWVTANCNSMDRQTWLSQWSLCAILRTRLETRSVPVLNHRESYKLVFKFQRWLNCRAGTKHGSFTGIRHKPFKTSNGSATKLQTRIVLCMRKLNSPELPTSLNVRNIRCIRYNDLTFTVQLYPPQKIARS
jgi:hypothetical protein